MPAYQTVMWSVAAALYGVHLVLLFRRTRRDWTSLNVMLPAMFLICSRPQISIARIGLWGGLGMILLYGSGIAYNRAIKGVEWERLHGIVIGMGESALLALLCGWGMVVLPVSSP